MRIDWSFDADVRRIDLHYNKKNETRTAIPTIVFATDENNARKVLGDRFYQLAFGTRDTNGRFGYTSLNPSLVFEQHMVSFENGCLVATQPIFDKVKPMNDEEIAVYLKLPFEINDEDLIVRLVKSFGESIHIELSPAQMALPFGKDNA